MIAYNHLSPAGSDRGLGKEVKVCLRKIDHDGQVSLQAFHCVMKLTSILKPRNGVPGCLHFNTRAAVPRPAAKGDKVANRSLAGCYALYSSFAS